MPKMSKLQASWLAGFIDGEGYISIVKVRKGNKAQWSSKNDFFYRPVLNVTNTNKEVIQWLYDSFGGTMEVRSMNRKNQRPAYGWTNRGTKRVQEIIKYVYPYLKVKKPEADIMLKFCKTVLIDGKPLASSIDKERDEMYEHIKFVHHNSGKGVSWQSERLSEKTS